MIDIKDWAERAFDKKDPYEFMTICHEMPLVPFVTSQVKDHMERMLDTLDDDALAWCSYICTRDFRCPKSKSRPYPAERPEKVFSSFLFWLQNSNAIVLSQWGNPTNVSVKMGSDAPLAVRWAYGDNAEFKVRTIDGDRIMIVSRVWTECDVIAVREADVLEAYVRTEVEQAAEYAKALSIPSRADETVTDQMKTAIDIALVLPHVGSNDDVLIVGSANGAEESHHLLAGQASRVLCVAPGESEVSYEIAGTKYERVNAEWQEGQPMIADVVIADASASDKRTIMAPVHARVYSLKLTTDRRDDPRKYEIEDFFEYKQLSATQERRLTSIERIHEPPRGRLGTCGACREVDSVWPSGYDFSPDQRKYWRIMHKYGAKECAYMQAPTVQVKLDTWLTYPRQLNDLLLCQTVSMGRCGEVIGHSRLLAERDGFSELLLIAAPKGHVLVAVAGNKTMLQSFVLGGRALQVSPRLWSLWEKGQCIDVGNGYASLHASWRDKFYKMPFRPPI